MKELKEFKSLIRDLHEGVAVINSNDFGITQNLSDIDFIHGVSFLEKGLAEIVGDVMAYGYSAKQADKMIKDAMEELMKTKVISTVPTEKDTDGQKAMWLNMARPRIVAHLKLTGKIL
jgi:hypothetical protein